MRKVLRKRFAKCFFCKKHFARFISPETLFVFMKKFVFLLSFLILSASYTFAQTGGIKGKIRASNGSGISGATVTVRQDGEDLKTVKSDNKGNFLLEGVKAGKYNVVFSKSGYSSGLMTDVEIVEKKVKNLGDRLILNVDQGSLVIINGSVYNQAGFAVYGASIKVERILSDGSTKRVNTGYTSRSGEFTFRFPDETAKFRITASAKGSQASKEIEVEGAAVYRLALNLTIEQ